MSEFVRVSAQNGLWSAVVLDWEAQCSAFGENLDDYATASLPVLQALAQETQRRDTGVFAVRNGDSFSGLCQLNVALLPGYDGRVLRVRHIVHSPRFDFDSSIEPDEYSSVLGDILVGVNDASHDEMLAPHIKFHFKSPAERVFFGALREALQRHGVFSNIELKGSWLYITK